MQATAQGRQEDSKGKTIALIKVINGSGLETYVNTAQIAYFYGSDCGETYIAFDKERWLACKEPIDAVVALIVAAEQKERTTHVYQVDDSLRPT